MQKNYYRIILSVYIAALAVCVSLQTVLRLGDIDPATGFYSRGNFLVTVLNLILLASVAFWFFMTLFRRTAHEFPVYRFRGTPRVFSGVCGLAILANTGYNTYTHFSFFRNMARWDQFLLIAIFIFGILGGLGMIWFAMRDGEGMWNGLGVFPSLWQLMILLGRYKQVPTLTTMSENLLLTLFMCFACIFLLGQSRTLCGYHPLNGRNYVIPSGLAASLFGFVSVVPAAAARLAGRKATVLIDFPLAFWFYVSALSVYAIIFLIGYIRSMKRV